jgi:hypothetical protein
MADAQDERKRIAGELARRRAEITDQSLLLRRDLNIGHRMSDSLRKHSWGWMSIAAMFGWLLSRLPARKKKIYVHSASSEKWKPPKESLMLQVWKGLWSIAKPLVVAYVTKQIAERAKIPGAKWL